MSGRRWPFILTLFVVASLFARAAAAVDLNVFAAISLTDALQEIAPVYEKESGDHLVLNLSGSSTLARQIEEGAPADLFFSADELKMDGLQKKGLVVAGTRKSVLSNTLVVVVPAESRLAIHSAQDLAKVATLALAEPSSVPAGIYAEIYLRKVGLWNRLGERIVPTENVRAALAAVETGNVDAAIVYKSDALISKRVRVAYEVPAAVGPKISYPFAVVAGSKNVTAAKKLLAYLQSPAAREVFKHHGFILLGN